MRAEIFRRVEQSFRPVVVFDVDSTLLSTAPRHLAILSDFAAEYGDSVFEAFVGSLQASDFGWTIEGPLPERFRAEKLLCALSLYWEKRFFSAEYLEYDVPILGAVEFVRELWTAGASIYYLTAREEEQMGEATRVSLLRLGFPIGHRVVLHLKPRGSLSDFNHKRAAIQRIRTHGQVVGTFENEPMNANLFVNSFPAAVHVLLATSHSPGAPPPSPLLHIWQDFLG